MRKVGFLLCAQYFAWECNTKLLKVFLKNYFFKFLFSHLLNNSFPKNDEDHCIIELTLDVVLLPLVCSFQCLLKWILAINKIFCFVFSPPMHYLRLWYKIWIEISLTPYFTLYREGGDIGRKIIKVIFVCG